MAYRSSSVAVEPSDHAALLFKDEGCLDGGGIEKLRQLLQQQPKLVDLRRPPILAANIGLGLTPLMAALRRGDERAAKLLYEANADVNLADEFGKTALMLAAEFGHGDLGLVALLVRGESNLDVNVADNEGDPFIL